VRVVELFVHDETIDVPRVSLKNSGGWYTRRDDEAFVSQGQNVVHARNKDLHETLDVLVSGLGDQCQTESEQIAKRVTTRQFGGCEYEQLTRSRLSVACEAAFGDSDHTCVIRWSFSGLIQRVCPSS